MSHKKESRLDNLLHSASRNGDLAKVSQILDTGRVYIDCKDQDGITPLMLACSYGHESVARKLLEEGADPNISLHSTPTKSVKYRKDIADTGTVDMNASMWDGATALFLAAQNGNIDVLNQLLEAPGIQLDRQRRDGASPLWIACQTGHPEAVSSLLQAGAQVDLPRNDGATPLHKACEKGHRKAVKELLKYKPQLGILQNGESCLHAGARSGDPEVVSCLLEAGADPNLTSLAGFRPVDLAIGDTRPLLGKVTTKSSVSSYPGGSSSRTSTPDRLSSIRSGASMYFRNSNPVMNASYSGSLNHVASPASCLAATSSSCNTSPASSPRRRASVRRSQYCLRPANGRPSSMDTTSSNNTGTPKHSVHFTDPILNKHGAIVTKVQCKILDTSELMPREMSPVPVALHLANLRRSTSSSPARAFPNTTV